MITIRGRTRRSTSLPYDTAALGAGTPSPVRALERDSYRSRRTITICPRPAATTNTDGSHTHGAWAIQSFAGSLWNTRTGVGVESTAIVRMFTSNTIPAAFQ